MATGNRRFVSLSAILLAVFFDGVATAPGATGAPDATGAQGPAGPQDPAGPAAPQGTAGTGAAYTTCTNNITGPETIYGDVDVPAKGYCTLGWDPPASTSCCNPPFPTGYGVVVVTGNVTVEQGASLVVGLNSIIVGTIWAKNCNFVELVSEGKEEVDGNVQIISCTGQPAFLSTGTGSVIRGGFQCLNNAGPCTLEEAIVGGAVQVLNNVTPSASKIEADQVFGNLQCQNNSPAPTNGGSGNTVYGSEQGQCADF